MKKKVTAKKISKPSSKASTRKKTSAIKAKRTFSKRSSALKQTISLGKNKKTKKVATKQATKRIRIRTGTKTKASVIYKTSQRPSERHRIVRIMGQGQFTVDNSTLKRLNEIDDSIVQLVSKERSDDVEFKKRLTELTDIVEAKGKPLDPKEIIQSDIILPSPDLSVDEAKRLFSGEGVIPETEV